MAGSVNTPHLNVVEVLKEVATNFSEGRGDSFEDVLIEYIEKSEHQGWDGFTARDLYGIRRFLTDFGIYVALGIEESDIQHLLQDQLVQTPIAK